ncbi:Putative propanediol utilization protein PduM [Salmonella enterica subsp. enterica serovar Typhimurium]|nr:Putative propanediol utilization protein PduM [Salmonella enterica subsp. enterica serovar Typhimurium]
MNGETLQRIVEEIVSRLQRRAQSTATLSVTQLRDADCPALFCQHASLRILLVDLPLLGQLADAETDDAAARKIHDALAFGIRVQLSLHSQLLPVIPVKKTGSSAAGIHRRARTAAGSACGFGAELSRCRAAKPGACGCPPQMHRDRHGA